MRGVFVTGTGTGVGKTIVSVALLAAMRAAGESVSAHKPVVTGLDEPRGLWPPDHELLAVAANMNPEKVAPLRYGPAVSPHLAAALAGEPIDSDKLIERARAAGEMTSSADRPRRSEDEPPGQTRDELRIVIVEGVGGLLVPFAGDFTVCTLAAALDLAVIVVASPGLGTINHTLLTLQAARAASLDVRAVVFTPWPEKPSAMEVSNRQAIEHLGNIEVVTLGHVSGPDMEELALRGDTLPWRQWLR